MTHGLLNGARLEKGPSTSMESKIFMKIAIPILQHHPIVIVIYQLLKWFMVSYTDEMLSKRV